MTTNRTHVCLLSLALHICSVHVDLPCIRAKKLHQCRSLISHCYWLLLITYYFPAETKLGLMAVGAIAGENPNGIAGTGALAPRAFEQVLSFGRIVYESVIWGSESCERRSVRYETFERHHQALLAPLR